MIPCLNFLKGERERTSERIVLAVMAAATTLAKQESGTISAVGYLAGIVWISSATSVTGDRSRDANSLNLSSLVVGYEGSNSRDAGSVNVGFVVDVGSGHVSAHLDVLSSESSGHDECCDGI